MQFEGREYRAEYYFQGDRLVSPIRYYSRNWNFFETDYFIFFLSDGSLFNEYSAWKLDAFVAKTLDILEVPREFKSKLQKEKIYYFRCRDTDEIRSVTGYASRGMYNLAYDYIITTFSCHYHEIVHLLVNYKLQKGHLYTHPFLQEGPAVALGGRGGREQPVIMNLGMFLQHSKFASYEDLLSYASFAEMDPSLSYPLSGLYNKFLIEELGIENYMTLYEQYSGENYQADISQSALPHSEQWESYLQLHAGARQIHVRPANETNCNSIYADALADIRQDARDVHFKMRGTVLIGEAQQATDYESLIYKELLPGVLYQGEKYLITANENEISIYNLYTNNLIAKYIPSMSVQKAPILVEDGTILFSVERTVFDEDLRRLVIRTIKAGGFPQQ